MPTTLKKRTNCHDSFGRAFKHQGIEGDEDILNSPRSLISPYWSHNFSRTSTSENSGAGVVCITYIGQDYDSESELSYLKARYLDSKRGQFLSQDPVFWEIAQSPDGIAVLRNPQAQNSYSYGQNNPIVNKDPDGRIAILAPILIGGGVGMLGGIGGQLISDYNSGEWSDLSTYGTAAVSGATVGVGVTIAGMTGGVLLVAGTAGGLTAGMQMASDAYLGKQTDYRDVITNSILSAGTAGVLKGVPAMKGRWPGLSSSALVVGRHTQRQAAEEAFSSGLQAVRQSVGTFISSSQSSSRSSGSSNNSSYVKQLKSIVTQLQSIVSKLKSLKK